MKWPNIRRNFEKTLTPDRLGFSENFSVICIPEFSLLEQLKNISLSNVRGWLYMATAFLMPFMPRLISVIIGLSFVCWLAEILISKNKPRLKVQYIMCLFPAFYLVHVIGLAWSENLDYGFFDLQIKLSMVIFPLMLLTVPLPSNAGQAVIARFFNYGCMVSVIVVLTRALTRYNDIGPEVFFYKDLSWFLHPAYFSMYLGLSLTFILARFIIFRTVKITALAAMQVLVLTLTIMLLSSKAGIFVLLFIVITLVFYMIRTKPALKLNLLIASVFLIISISLIFSKSIYGRLLEMRNNMTETGAANRLESSAIRLMAWKVSLDLISTNPVLGTGTGDVKDELLKKYLSDGYELLYEQRVNSHNQFLQTMAALGIPGILALSGIFLSLVVTSFRRRDMLLMCFLIIVFVNAMVESFLEVQAGVIFFTFFYGVLNSENKRQVNQSNGAEFSRAS